GPKTLSGNLVHYPSGHPDAAAQCEVNRDGFKAGRVWNLLNGLEVGLIVHAGHDLVARGLGKADEPVSASLVRRRAEQGMTGDFSVRDDVTFDGDSAERLLCLPIADDACH